MGLACRITGHKWYKLPDGKDGCTCSPAKSAAAAFQTVVGWHTPTIRELEDVLPDDPEGLRPYAYDIYVILQTWLRCDLTVFGDKPDSRKEAMDRFERACAKWKKSAQALISLAKEQPEVIYPVKGQLARVINGAEAQVRDRRQVGFKMVYQKVAPDAPEDWTEAVKVPDYKYSTKKIPMNLHFPAE